MSVTFPVLGKVVFHRADIPVDNKYSHCLYRSHWKDQTYLKCYKNSKKLFLLIMLHSEGWTRGPRFAFLTSCPLLRKGPETHTLSPLLQFRCVFALNLLNCRPYKRCLGEKPQLMTDFKMLSSPFSWQTERTRLEPQRKPMSRLNDSSDKEFSR